MSAVPLALRARGVWKRFPGTQALRDVALELGRGQVHALLGGNGSGKTTLVKILAGVLAPDRGTIAIGSRELDARRLSPRQVFDLGLRFVHQEDEGFGSLSIAENLAGVRGFPHDGLGRIRWRVLHRRAQDLLDRYEIRADARQRLDTLRPATIRMVAIARALQDRDEADDGILVLDEPAAALPPAEVGLLHEALRRYAAAGQAILYVTHRLDELEDFADRATVLRDGAVAGSLGGSELRHDRLVKLIAGETLAPHPRAPRLEAQSDIRLEVRRCTGGPLSDVSLTVRAGEVLGVAGLDGSGRSSLLQMIFGVLARTSGEVHFDGMPLRAGAVPAHPGLAYLPESRSHAAFANLSLAVNLSAASHDRYGRRLGWRHRLERVEARAAIRRFGIAAKGEDQEFLTLSGGNQQKAILARWLRRGPAVLLLDEPTQGVDVGARADVHELIRASTRRGGTAIVVSSDFEELATLSDRVIVLRQGRIAGELDSANIDPRHLERAVHGRAPSR